MTTKKHKPHSKVANLEATGDYPVAPAESWVAAPRANHEEILTPRQNVAGITVTRDQLQADLSALTAKRHELEELLLTRDALLSNHERELSARSEQIETLRDSLAASTISRDQLQADLNALSTRLKELEQPASEGEAQPLELERTVAERDQRLAELTEELAARAQQAFLASAERDDLQARLERARADLASMAQRRERQPGGQADAELARRNVALARSHDEMTELQRRVGAHHEALQRGEARRQIYEAMLRDSEEMLEERDARLRSLQDEFDSRRRDHDAALARANAQLAAALARAGGAERHFGQQFQGAPAAESQPPPAMSALPVADPEAQRVEIHEAVRALQEQMQGEQGANDALRGDLAACAPPLPKGRRLLVRTDGEAGIVHVLGRRTTIGRIPANDLRIDTDFISRHHAVVLVTDTSTVVEDLHSTNGVFVNDVRVMRHALLEGDLLTIGKTSFRYVLKPETDHA